MRSGIFLSTPSARRATIPCRFPAAGQTISIHALREEGDVRPNVCNVMVKQFLSTPSARRATSSTLSRRAALVDFYPRPPRGGRPIRELHARGPEIISIHALREEGDRCGSAYAPAGDISIHALREEGDKEV